MRLKIAIQKSGRLADDSLDLLNHCGLAFAQSKNKLFWYGKNLPIDLLLVRDDDIPQLLWDDVCQLGIVGQNVVQEFQLAGDRDRAVTELVQLRTLNFGQCRLALAVPETMDYQGLVTLQGKRIATSYPGMLNRFLLEHAIEAKIVPLSGSVEIAPYIDTADLIADLVASGATLKANHLHEVETISQIQAAVYRNNSAADTDSEALLDRLLKRIDGVQQASESKYVMLHAPRDAVDEVSQLLPGAESPTVLPLAGQPGKVAIHAVCREGVFWDHLEELKAAGASAVLVLPIEKMLI